VHRRLNRGQRIGVLIGLGVGLLAFGRWVTDLGAQGWVSYAPLSSQPSGSPGGLHAWVRLVVWLALIAAWTVLAVVMLRNGQGSTPPDPN